MTQLVDPWYGDKIENYLTTDEDIFFWFLDDIGFAPWGENELSDSACMRLCGALESEIV